MAYTVQKELSRHRLLRSYNRLGYCMDNAHMASFYHNLKGELIRGRTYKNEKKLRESLCSYINQFYNRTRLHSGFKAMMVAFYVSILSIATGCASFDEDLRGAATMQIQISPGVNVSDFLGSCEGLVFERHSYENGDGSLYNPSRQTTLRSISEEYVIEPDITKFIRKQSGSELCWASSLETIFRYKGYDYKEREFIDILKNHCGTSDNSGATLREILFAASSRHTGKPSWPELKNQHVFHEERRSYNLDLSKFFLFLYYYNDGNKSSSFDTRRINANTIKRTYFNAYSQVSWHKKGNKHASLGGIFHAPHTGNMLYYILNNIPLLVGLRERGGHTVIVYGAEYRLGGVDNRDLGRTIMLDERTMIESFYIMDPYDNGSGEHLYIQDASDLLGKADFIYAFDIRS